MNDAELIAKCAEDIIALEDGYQYYWAHNKGALSAHNLRVIAAELDKRNAVHHAQVVVDSANMALETIPQNAVLPASAVRIAELGGGYAIKFDSLRSSKQWTALGPCGRLADADTEQEALTLIAQDKAANNKKDDT